MQQSYNLKNRLHAYKKHILLIYIYNIFIPPMGLEPTIFRLEVERVIQLRQEGTKIQKNDLIIHFFINI